MTVRRYVVSALIGLSVVASYDVASAQVGHDPATSPYRDILKRSGPVLFVGRLMGDRGRAGAGPSDGLTIGTRYEMPAGRSLMLQFSAAYFQGDRFIIDPRPDSTSPQRRTGPNDVDLLLTEVGMHLRLTGGKSWRGLSPFVGVGLGIAFELSAPGDTTGSGFNFGTKLMFNGATGVRWYAGRRVTVIADVRGQLWRLRYPVSFHAAAGDGSRVVPLEEPLTDWTFHPWISLGIGWTF